MATIATHNGSAVARQHNLRNPKITGKEDHIDPEGIHEVWLDEAPKAAYERLFGEAVRAYNEKQSRPDRKIADYYKKILEDKKKHPVYEMIAGVYDKSISFEMKREILCEYADGWNERNPNLELIGLYFHADEEGEEHLHADYIPVARGCKRGLETQTALVKALEQQGIVSGPTMKETAQILWQRKENAALEQLCLERGISVDHPQRDGEKKQHLDTDLYKLQKKKESLEKDLEDLLEQPPIEVVTEKKEVKAGAFKKEEVVVLSAPDQLVMQSKQLEALHKAYGQQGRELQQAKKELEEEHTKSLGYHNLLKNIFRYIYRGKLEDLWAYVQKQPLYETLKTAFQYEKDKSFEPQKRMLSREKDLRYDDD